MKTFSGKLYLRTTLGNSCLHQFLPKYLTLCIWALVFFPSLVGAQMEEYYFVDTTQKYITTSNYTQVRQYGDNFIVCGSIGDTSTQQGAFIEGGAMSFARMDVNGHRIWNRTILNPDYPPNYCDGFSTLHSAHFFLSDGFVYIADQVSGWMVKLEADTGNTVWMKKKQLLPGQQIVFSADLNDSLFAIYHTYIPLRLVTIRKSDGSVKDSIQLTNANSNVQLLTGDQASNIFIGGPTLKKYDADMNLVWEKNYAASNNIKSIRKGFFMSDGNLIIIASGDYYNNCKIAKINPSTGDLISVIEMPSNSIPLNTYSIVDYYLDNGILYAAWERAEYNPPLNKTYFAFTKMDLLSNQLLAYGEYIPTGAGYPWQIQENTTPFVTALTIDQAGDVYLTGSYGTYSFQDDGANWVIVKFSGQSGGFVYETTISQDYNEIDNIGIGSHAFTVNGKPYFIGSMELLGSPSDHVWPTIAALDEVTGEVQDLTLFGGKNQEISHFKERIHYGAEGELHLKKVGQQTVLTFKDYANTLLWEKVIQQYDDVSPIDMTMLTNGQIAVLVKVWDYNFTSDPETSFFAYIYDGLGNELNVYPLSICDPYSIRIVPSGESDFLLVIGECNGGGPSNYANHILKIEQGIVTGSKYHLFLQGNPQIESLPNNNLLFYDIDAYHVIDKATLEEVATGSIPVNINASDNINKAVAIDAHQTVIINSGYSDATHGYTGFNITLFDKDALSTLWHYNTQGINPGVTAVAYDGNNAIYGAGMYWNTQVFGIHNLFIAKLDKTTGQATWTKTIYVSELIPDFDYFRAVPHEMAYDKLRNLVIIVGELESNTQCDPPFKKEFFLLAIDTNGQIVEKIIKTGKDLFYYGTQMTLWQNPDFSFSIAGGMERTPYGLAGFIYQYTPPLAINANVLTGIVGVSVNGGFHVGSKVEMLDLSGNLLGSTNVDAQGRYLFTNVVPGTDIYIRVVPDTTAHPGTFTTYYDTALVIQNAVPIELATGLNIFNFDGISSFNDQGEEELTGVVLLGDNLLPEYAANQRLIFQRTGAALQTELITDDQGAFYLNGIPSGNYSILADKLGINNQLAPTFTLPDNANGFHLSLVLHPTWLELLSTNCSTLAESEASTCFGIPYEGHTASGTYYDVSPAPNGGCDTIHILYLTVDTLLDIMGDSPVDTVCSLDATGFVQVSVTGGMPPYLFTWFKEGTFYSNEEDIDGLLPANYVLSVQDQQGCMGIFEATIPGYNDILVDISINSSGDTLFTVVASPTNGQPPYLFEWSNGDAGPQTTFADLGDYSVTVTDAMGCSAVQTFTIILDAISEGSKQVLIRCFPNPVQTSVYIVPLPSGISFRASLFDSQGKICATKNLRHTPNGHCFDFPETLPNGIYFLMISSSESTIVQKLALRK